MDSKQKYYPHFGFVSPRRIEKECENPAFADKNLHRIGIFAVEFHEDALTGYSCIQKCVNCGVLFGYSEEVERMFIPSEKREDILLE